jgi:hypothetical protein
MDRVGLVFCSIRARRHVRVRIADIREFTPESWRNIIGVVPQVYNHLEQSEVTFHLSDSSPPASRIPYCLLAP